jgi:protease-4
VLCPVSMLPWLIGLLAAPLVGWLAWRLSGVLRWRWRRPRQLELVLSGSLPDLPALGGVRSWLRRSGGPDLVTTLQVLEAAARDPKVLGLVVKVEHLECGLGKAEELRAALARFRESGKTVILYADELGLAGYWLALGASSIRLAPTGSLNVAGVAMEFTLLEGALARVGLRAQLLARGKYKSMREMFTASQMSEANREMLTSLVGDLHEQLVIQVANARGKTPAEVAAAIDQGPFRAEEARALGLVDQLTYPDQLRDELGAEDGKVQHVGAYRRLLARGRLRRRRGTSVALLNVTGTIRSGHDRQGQNGPRATGHLSFQRAVRRATKSERVRAIVLRVDSPGGSALASDLMWRELTLAAKKKPLFVSMANVAASGGYYTSAIDGVPVWANPNTLTGSIGVVGGKFEASGLLAKLGIGRETVGSGRHASYYSVTSPWSDEELAKVDRDIDAAYRDFVSKMADARHLSYEALERVAQGRVWTGRQALEASLVDHMGGLWDVEAALRERLKLGASAPIRWLGMSASRGFWPRRDEDAELSARVTGWLGTRLPGLANVLDLALDLGGERLLALSPILGKRNAE